MGVGDIIESADFNRVHDKVVEILGTSSSGSYGYGQTIQSSRVDASKKVSVDGWTKLQYDLITISRHQTGTIPTLPLPEPGKKIVFNSTTAPVNRFENFVANLDNNRFNINSSFLRDGVFASQDITVAWKESLSITGFVTWSSAQAARHFFNLGGRIRVTSVKSQGTRTGGSQTIRLQNLSWENLLNSRVDDLIAIPTTTSDPIDRYSWYRLDNNTTVASVSVAASGDYEQNRYNLYAYTPDSTDNRTGNSKQLAVTFEFLDGHTPDGGSTLDGVDGNMKVQLQVMKPQGSTYPSNAAFNIPADPSFSWSSWNPK